MKEKTVNELGQEGIKIIDFSLAEPPVEEKADKTPANGTATKDNGVDQVSAITPDAQDGEAEGTATKDNGISVVTEVPPEETAITPDAQDGEAAITPDFVIPNDPTGNLPQPPENPSFKYNNLVSNESQINPNPDKNLISADSASNEQFRDVENAGSLEKIQSTIITEADLYGLKEATKAGIGKVIDASYKPLELLVDLASKADHLLEEAYNGKTNTGEWFKESSEWRNKYRGLIEKSESIESAPEPTSEFAPEPTSSDSSDHIVYPLYGDDKSYDSSDLGAMNKAA